MLLLLFHIGQTSLHLQKDHPRQPITKSEIKNMAIVKRMLIKCADVSNPARPLNICRQWAYRIAEEYFTQVSIKNIQ